MKRQIFAWLLCLVLALSLAVGAEAAKLPRVVDGAEVLTKTEEEALEYLTDELRETWNMDVVLVTVRSLGGKSPAAYADDYYDNNGYGCGSDYSGMLFLLALESRDWYISTCGKAIEVLTDYGIQQSAQAALPQLSRGDYYEGLRAWLEVLPEYLERWQEGTPVDVPGTYRERGVNWGLSALLGLLAAGVSVPVMVSMNRTKAPQAGARSYFNRDSFRLVNQKDLFLGSHVNKVPRTQRDSSGRGGSSIHRSSSGRTHGGGGGKF